MTTANWQLTRDIVVPPNIRQRETLKTSFAPLTHRQILAA
jgi:hypothetical protein